MACACETIRSQASIAAARKTYDCAGVSMGPLTTETTTSSAMRACARGSEAAASNRSAGSAAATEAVAAAAAAPSIAGKILASANVEEAVEERSITPRWIKIEGNTLSANTGRCEACGMGKDGEEAEASSFLSRFAAKRMAIAFIRKSAFLKQ